MLFGSTSLKMSALPYGPTYGQPGSMTTMKAFLRTMPEAGLKAQAGGNPPQYIFDEAVLRQDGFKLLRAFGLPPAAQSVQRACNNLKAQLVLGAHHGWRADCRFFLLAVPTERPLFSPKTIFERAFAGPRGSAAHLHFHQDAVNLLRAGQKRWILKPPALREVSTRHTAEWLRGLNGPAARELPAEMTCTQQAGQLMCSTTAMLPCDLKILRPRHTILLFCRRHRPFHLQAAAHRSHLLRAGTSPTCGPTRW